MQMFKVILYSFLVVLFLLQEVNTLECYVCNNCEIVKKTYLQKCMATNDLRAPENAAIVIKDVRMQPKVKNRDMDSLLSNLLSTLAVLIKNFAGHQKELNANENANSGSDLESEKLSMIIEGNEAIVFGELINVTEETWNYEAIVDSTMAITMNRQTVQIERPSDQNMKPMSTEPTENFENYENLKNYEILQNLENLENLENFENFYNSSLQNDTIIYIEKGSLSKQDERPESTVDENISEETTSESIPTTFKQATSSELEKHLNERSKNNKSAEIAKEAISKSRTETLKQQTSIGLGKDLNERSKNKSAEIPKEAISKSRTATFKQQTSIGPDKDVNERSKDVISKSRTEKLKQKTSIAPDKDLNERSKNYKSAEISKEDIVKTRTGTLKQQTSFGPDKDLNESSKEAISKSGTETFKQQTSIGPDKDLNEKTKSNKTDKGSKEAITKARAETIKLSTFISRDKNRLTSPEDKINGSIAKATISKNIENKIKPTTLTNSSGKKQNVNIPQETNSKIRTETNNKTTFKDLSGESKTKKPETTHLDSNDLEKRITHFRKSSILDEISSLSNLEDSVSSEIPLLEQDKLSRSLMSESSYTKPSKYDQTKTRKQATIATLDEDSITDTLLEVTDQKPKASYSSRRVYGSSSNPKLDASSSLYSKKRFNLKTNKINTFTGEFDSEKPLTKWNVDLKTSPSLDRDSSQLISILESNLLSSEKPLNDVSFSPSTKKPNSDDIDLTSHNLITHTVSSKQFDKSFHDPENPIQAKSFSSDLLGPYYSYQLETTNHLKQHTTNEENSSSSLFNLKLLDSKSTKIYPNSTNTKEIIHVEVTRKPKITFSSDSLRRSSMNTISKTNEEEMDPIKTYGYDLTNTHLETFFNNRTSGVDKWNERQKHRIKSIIRNPFFKTFKRTRSKSMDAFKKQKRHIMDYNAPIESQPSSISPNTLQTYLNLPSSNEWIRISLHPSIELKKINEMPKSYKTKIETLNENEPLDPNYIIEENPENQRIPENSKTAKNPPLLSKREIRNIHYTHDYHVNVINLLPSSSTSKSSQKTEIDPSAANHPQINECNSPLCKMCSSSSKNHPKISESNNLNYLENSIEEPSSLSENENILEMCATITPEKMVLEYPPEKSINSFASTESMNHAKGLLHDNNQQEQKDFKEAKAPISIKKANNYHQRNKAVQSKKGIEYAKKKKTEVSKILSPQIGSYKSRPQALPVCYVIKLEGDSIKRGCVKIYEAEDPCKLLTDRYATDSCRVCEFDGCNRGSPKIVSKLFIVLVLIAPLFVS